MTNVPTNVRDLDSHIVSRFMEIHSERGRLGVENDTPEAIEEMINPIAGVVLGLFIEGACERANVVYAGNFTEVREQAKADYVSGFNDASHRRSVLYKMCNDARDIISKLPKKPDPIFSDETMNAYSNFKIDDNTMASIQKTLQQGAGLTKKYSKKDPSYYNTKNPDPYNP